jgi:hypothetical protein
VVGIDFSLHFVFFEYSALLMPAQLGQRIIVCFSDHQPCRTQKGVRGQALVQMTPRWYKWSRTCGQGTEVGLGAV